MMLNDKPLLDPENQPTWIAVSFVIALLALVVAFISVQHTNKVLLATQAEVLVLNKRIVELQSPAAPAAQAPAAAAPAAPAK